MTLFITFITIYFLLICLVIFKKKFIHLGTSTSKLSENVSIVIALRNEEKNLEQLIQALLNQNYNQEKIEFIFVNDRSTDNSLSILENNKVQFKHIKIITINKLEKGVFGKKNALEQGIKEASSDILLFTDADCIPEKNWIENIVSLYDNKTKSVIGNAELTPAKRNFTSYFQRSENKFNHIVAFLSLMFNYPLMSFGRNFSYRKTAFKAVGKFENINQSISGDDDLLLGLFAEQNFLIKHSNSNVISKTCDNIKSYIGQKTRHLSATRFIPIKVQIIMALLQLLNLSFYLILLQDYYYLFLAKLLLDAILFSYVLGKIKLKFNILDLILWELFYPIFIILIPIKGYLTKIRHIKWKQS